MSDNVQEIRMTFSGLIEQMAFLFVDPSDPDDLALDEGSLLASSVSVTGDVEGRVEVAMAEALCRELAANMLGEDDPDDITEEQAADSFRELANVVCGHLVTTIAGNDIICEISPPTVTRLAEDDARALADDPACMAFESEGEPVLLRYELRGAKKTA